MCDSLEEADRFIYVRMRQGGCVFSICICIRMGYVLPICTYVCLSESARLYSTLPADWYRHRGRRTC